VTSSAGTNESAAAVTRFAVLGVIALLVVAAIASVIIITPIRPVNDDAARLFYLAWTMDALGQLPYVDFLNGHPPLALLAYQWSGKIFGFTLAGARFADLAFTAASLGAIALLVAPAGWWPAAFALGALTLLQGEPAFLLQRETIALPLLLLGLAALASPRIPSAMAAFFAGIGAGVATAVRPQFASAIVAIACWIVWRERTAGRSGLVLRQLAWLAAGVALPALATALYLSVTNTWSGFIDVMTEYWPLYARFNYGPLGRTWKQTIGLPAMYAFRSGHLLWLVAAAAGLFVAVRQKPELRQRAVLLAVMVIALAAYPALGHSFPNHWLPFLYVSVALASLALASLTRRATAAAVAASLIVLLVSAHQVQLPDALISRIVVGVPPGDAGELGMVTRWLRAHGGRALTVQTMGWSDGEFAAMLMAEVRPGTSNPIPMFGFALPSGLDRAWWQAFVEEFRRRQPAIVICPRWMYSDFTRDRTGSTLDVIALLDGYEPVLMTTHRVLYRRMP
jgi:hypothetical protein